MIESQLKTRGCTLVTMLMPERSNGKNAFVESSRLFPDAEGGRLEKVAYRPGSCKVLHFGAKNESVGTGGIDPAIL